MDVWAVAAPTLTGTGNLMAALAMGDPAFRLNRRKGPAFGKLAIQYAKRSDIILAEAVIQEGRRRIPQTMIFLRPKRFKRESLDRGKGGRAPPQDELTWDNLPPTICSPRQISPAQKLSSERCHQQWAPDPHPRQAFSIRLNPTLKNLNWKGSGIENGNLQSETGVPIRCQEQRIRKIGFEE